MSTRPGPLGQQLVAELRAEMARQRRSGRWMAEHIGQPHNTVARWLAGDSTPGADNLDAMCQVLGFRLADLIVAVQSMERDEHQPGDPRRRIGDRFGLALAS